MRPAPLALAATALLCACGPAAAPPAEEANGAAGTPEAAAPGTAFPALTGRVVDLGDVLAPEQEQSLAAELAELERRTTDQLVILIVPSIDGRTIEDYARDLGNHWGIGQAGKDNGVLLVVALAERRVRIAVGSGLERILPDGRAEEIIQTDILPRFREGLPFEGIQAGARSVIATLIAAESQPRLGRT